MKKYLALSLALLTVLLCFAACGDKEEGGSSAAPSEAESTASEASAAESTTYQDMLEPATDLGGREFYIMQRWFGYDKESIDFQGEVIWQDSDDGTMSNLNLAKRKVLDQVQERYNCKVTGEMSTETAGDIREKIIRPDVMSTHDIDFCFETYYYYYSFVTGGLLTDLNTLGIDFSKPWWDQNGVEDLSVAGKLYYALGDINTYDNDGTVVMLFNKDLYDEKFGGEGAHKELYELAESGNWTFEELTKRVTNFGTEETGDNVRDEFDSYGLLTEDANLYIHVVAAGQKAIDKDANDALQFSFENERVYDSFNAAVELYNNTNDVLNTSRYEEKYGGSGSGFYVPIINAFKEGRGLFFMGALIHLPGLRDMEDDFGILPVPKYDANQDRYYHTMGIHTASVLFVPISPKATGEQGKQMGVLLDALGAYSKDYLTPEYYEKQLKRGDASDPDSAKMLDVIFGSRTFDLGAVFAAAVGNPIDWCSINGNLQTQIQANKDIVEMDIEDVMADILENE